MGDESGRSRLIITCGLVAALGFAAGMGVGLPIGALKSESRQSIEAERDQAAQKVASLAGENARLRKITKIDEDFRAKYLTWMDELDHFLGLQPELIRSLRSGEQLTDEWMNEFRQSSERLIRLRPSRLAAEQSGNQPAERFAGDGKRRRDAIVVAFGSTLTLLSVFTTDGDVCQLHAPSDVLAGSDTKKLAFLLLYMAGKLDQDAEQLREYEAMSRPLVDHWIASAEELSREGKFDKDEVDRWRNHFNKRVFGPPRITTEKSK